MSWCAFNRNKFSHKGYQGIYVQGECPRPHDCLPPSDMLAYHVHIHVQYICVNVSLRACAGVK